MKRSRIALSWFAAGAATSAAVATALVREEPDEVFPYLRITEPNPELSPENYSEVASFAGRMLRECGATRFDVTSWGVDVQSYAYLPLVEENSKAIGCVLKRSAEDSFESDLVFDLPDGW